MVPCELPECVGDLDDVCDEIEKLGRKSLPVELQLPEAASIEAAVGRVVAEMERIDVLVNNAGVNVPSEAFDVTEQDWDAVMDVNLKGLFFMSQAVGRRMRESGGGKIVNMSSMLGLVGYPQRAVYAAAKGAINQLTRVLALEWAEHGICVNALAPTHIETDWNKARVREEAFVDEMLPQIPLGRIGIPEEVVGATIFLCSSAADLITGQVLAVDGVWTAR